MELDCGAYATRYSHRCADFTWKANADSVSKPKTRIQKRRREREDFAAPFQGEFGLLFKLRVCFAAVAQFVQSHVLRRWLSIVHVAARAPKAFARQIFLFH
jgi:hypothetical protein